MPHTPFGFRSISELPAADPHKRFAQQLQDWLNSLEPQPPMHVMMNVAFSLYATLVLQRPEHHTSAISGCAQLITKIQDEQHRIADTLLAQHERARAPGTH